MSIAVQNGIHTPNYPTRSLVTIVTELYRIPYSKLTARLLLIGFEVLTPMVMQSSILWDITPCSLLKVNRLPPVFTLVSSLAYSSILKTKATCSSETLVDFQLTTRRYIPEDTTLQAFYLIQSFTNGNQQTFFFVGWDLCHQVLRPLLAYCTAPDDR
jgi:hypothetical protein